MNRILSVARLQLAGARSILLWPVVIMALAFVVNLALYASMGAEWGERPFTGGLASIYVTVVAFGATAVTQHFRFAAGLSVTRRVFFAATALLIAAQSVLYGTLLTVLEAVERATDGWGANLYFYAPIPIDQYPWWVRLLLFAAPFVLLNFVGVVYGVLHVRWGTNGVFTAGVVVLAVAGGLAVLLTWRHWWWLVTDRSPLTLVAGWPLLAGVLLAGAGWVALRRAAP